MRRRRQSSAGIVAATVGILVLHQHAYLLGAGLLSLAAPATAQQQPAPISVSDDSQRRRRRQRRSQQSIQEAYSADGTGNNLLHPSRGSAGQPRIRSHPNLDGYADGRSAPRADLPSARRILTELFRVAPVHPNKRASQLLPYFGQFVGHDITRSISYPPGRTEEAMPIECDGAEFRGPFCPAGAAEMPFARTQRVAAVEEDQPSAPVNFASSFLDLDHLYGPVIGGPPESDVRTLAGDGKMRLDADTGLPPRADAAAGGQYVVADPQTRLVPSLLSLATVFLRYHNRRADSHRAENPDWTDEELYRAARMDTIAAYQRIVEERYAPALLGEALGPYRGYDPGVDPTVDVFFSTCSYRYGHSSLSGAVRLVDANFERRPRDPLLLRDAYNGTEAVFDLYGDGPGGVAADVLRGMVVEPAKSVDATFVDDVSLFTGAMTVKNIQRGRDNGLPSYNDARASFGLARLDSMDELAKGMGDGKVADALRNLYGRDGVDDVDAYVGGLLEKPAGPNNVLGPLMTASIREQFVRLRDGDRLWYGARLSPEEIEELPSLSDMIKMTFGEEEMRYFPSDSFAVVDQCAATREVGRGASSLSLLDGSYTMSWEAPSKDDADWIDVTLRVNELIRGGFIGIGFGEQSMAGAEIWFCTASGDAEPSPSCDDPRSTSEDAASGGIASAESVFSCCVAPGRKHAAPRCANEGDGSYYPLQVVDSCQSQDSSFVTVRAPLCGSDSDGGCFRLPGGVADFIAAYSPSSAVKTHGFSRRTMGRLDLISGSGAAVASDSANVGLFALHGLAMLICWMVLTPVAIFIVHYMKGKSWRLFAHIGLVGTVGSLMLSLATAALVSVEGTSFGTVDGESAVVSDHKAAGLGIVAISFFMLATGEMRRTRGLSNRLGRRLDRAVLTSHRVGGLSLVALSWWNCYTGLVQIGPYESDDVEITWFSSRASTTPLGYDVEFFGFIRSYIFFPWMAIVCLIFLVSEVLMQRSRGAEHKKRVEEVRKGAKSLWGSEPINDVGLQTISIDTFLDLTQLGSAFCIVDGYVLDIGTFMDVHPGGRRIIRYAVGSDITQYLIGQHDVNGVRHVHSPVALQTLRTLVKAKLDVPSESDSPTLAPQNDGSTGRQVRRNLAQLVFRRAEIMDIECVTAEKRPEAKPVVRVRLALKREKGSDVVIGTPLPGTTFSFRGRDSFGGTVERSYTPVKSYIRRSNANVGSTADPDNLPLAFPNLLRTPPSKEEIVYEFLVSLVPGGNMSSFLMNKRPGSSLMVKGPLASETVLGKLNSQQWSDIVLIAQGTGLSSMLQVIDYFLDQTSPVKEFPNTSLSGPPKSHDGPRVFLAWFVKYKSLCYEDAAHLGQRLQHFGRNFRYFIFDQNDDPISGLLTAKNISFFKRLNHVSSLNIEYMRSNLMRKSVPKLHPDESPSLGTSGNIQDDPFSNKEVAADQTKKPSVLGSIHEDPDEMHEILDQYRAKKRLDKYLVARLLALATGKDLRLPFDDSTESDMPAAANENDFTFEAEIGTEVKTEAPAQAGAEHENQSLHRNTLVAVCGRPAFDDQCHEILEEIGLNSEQIVLFHGCSTPLSQLASFNEKANSAPSNTGNRLSVLFSRIRQGKVDRGDRERQGMVDRGDRERQGMVDRGDGIKQGILLSSSGHDSVLNWEAVTQDSVQEEIDHDCHCSGSSLGDI